MGIDKKRIILKQAFEQQMPINKLLGLKILALEDGFVKVHVPFKEEFIGDFIQKRWHGGIQASIADSAGGIVALTSITDINNEKVNTIDMRIDYLHGSEPMDFYAEATLIKNGKRIIKADIELYHEKSKIIAVARCAYSVLRK